MVLGIDGRRQQWLRTKLCALTKNLGVLCHEILLPRPASFCIVHGGKYHTHSKLKMNFNNNECETLLTLILNNSFVTKLIIVVLVFESHTLYLNIEINL